MSSDAPSAFFSYSRNDSEFALRLAEDLKAGGANVWLDQLDIEPGQRWTRAVEEALNRSPRMLVILSPAAVESTHVEDEVHFALEEHKTVIPVLYQDCKVPFQLRPFQYVDFRTDYQRGLQVMLRTLGVSHGSTPNAAAEEKQRGTSRSAEQGTDVERARSNPERRRAYEKTVVENHARQWQAEQRGQSPPARPAYEPRAGQEQQHAKAAGEQARAAEEQRRSAGREQARPAAEQRQAQAEVVQARAPKEADARRQRERAEAAERARREQGRIELPSGKAEAESRVVKWVFIAGLAIFAVSFVLYAVMVKGVGSNSPLFGFYCAYISLLMGSKGVIEAVSAQPFNLGVAFLQLTILLSGLINPVFLFTLLFKRKHKLQRTFAALRITTLALFPFCWMVFAQAHIVPREGYFVWVAGMGLALFPSQMGRLIGRRSRTRSGGGSI